MEFEVDEGSPVVGKQVKDLALPHECLLTSAHWGRKVLILHGDTVLQAGDQVMALVEQDCADALRDVFLKDE